MPSAFWLSFSFFVSPRHLLMVPQEQNSQSQYPRCTFSMTGAPAENIEIIFNLGDDIIFPGNNNAKFLTKG